MGALSRSRWHAHRSESDRGAVFRRRGSHVPGVGLRSFAGVPIPAGPGRSGQLARRNEGSVRVVPAARERMGRRAVRQRIVNRRGRRPVSRPLALPLVRNVASRLRHRRIVRVPLAAAVSVDVPQPRDSSAGFPRRSVQEILADREADQPAADETRPAHYVLRPAEAAADVGDRHRQGADRSGVVPHHRLVRAPAE